MTEILTMIGIENATKVIAWVLAFISVSAITTGSSKPLKCDE